MKKINALIIGAGKIGAFFDSPTDKRILTHAHAYNQHKGFNLVGFVDSDEYKAKEASNIWGGRAFGDLSEAFEALEVDVVSICTPDKDHYHTLSSLKNKSKLIGGIIEKPLTDSIKTGAKIAKDMFFTERPFLVNYMRRYTKEFQMVARNIKKGQYGNLLTGSIYYGRGLMNNASHMIDLLYFFGQKVTSVKFIETVDDFYPDDLSHRSVIGVAGGGQLYLGVVPAEDYRVLEIDLFFEKGRVKVLHDGFEVEEYEVMSDDVFKGYKVLKKSKIHKTTLDRYMYHVVDDLYLAVTKNTRPQSTVDDAYEVQKICNQIVIEYEKS